MIHSTLFTHSLGLKPHHASCSDKHGLCFVSADYRLAPQTRLPGILADCKAAIDYIRSPVFAAETNNRVNASKIVVSGSSAGGFLALLAGTGIGYAACGLEPPSPIAGIAAIYPITGLEDSFWKTTQHPVSYMDRVISHEEVVPFIDPNDAKVAFSPLDSKRSIFYAYMIQEYVFLFPFLLWHTRYSGPSSHPFYWTTLVFLQASSASHLSFELEHSLLPRRTLFMEQSTARSRIIKRPMSLVLWKRKASLLNLSLLKG